MIKVGDKVIVIADVVFKGEIYTIVKVEDGIAYIDQQGWVGYWTSTGAGRLVKESDRPFVRKLTPLDELL
jgi:hypothetical protein